MLQNNVRYCEINMTYLYNLLSITNKTFRGCAVCMYFVQPLHRHSFGFHSTLHSCTDSNKRSVVRQPYWGCILVLTCNLHVCNNNNVLQYATHYTCTCNSCNQCYSYVIVIVIVICYCYMLLLYVIVTVLYYKPETLYVNQPLF